MGKTKIEKQHTASYDQLYELLSVASDAIKNIGKAVEDNEKVTASSLNELKGIVDAMAVTIEENEKVTAHALNELNAKYENLASIIEEMRG